MIMMINFFILNSLFFFIILLFLFFFFYINFNSILLINWIFLETNSTKLSLQLIFDKPIIFFLITVWFISFNVFLFAKSYMALDKKINQFFIFLFLFVISINLLIIIPNIIFIILGWDGLGLVSFILIAHYHTKSALHSSIITLITNRIGDITIIISIVLMFHINSWSPFFIHKFSIPLSIIIIITSITKRAQIPFRTWLLAAIAAPTPVSALVHSSTLVTAGVFLLFRFFPSINNSHSLLWFLSISSSLTIICTRVEAIFQKDLKKLVALSTLRQLGLIIIALSLNMYYLAFFHLLIHAIFKALLFITIGNLILQISHFQDVRFFKKKSLFSINSTRIIIAIIALSAFPFSAAFFSKDKIIELIFSSFHNTFISLILYFSVILTCFYSFNIIKQLLFSSSLSFPLIKFSLSDKFTNISLLSITSLSIIWGAFINWSFIQPISSINFSIPRKWNIISLIFLSIFLCISIEIYSIKLPSFFSLWTSITKLPSFSLKYFYPFSDHIYSLFDSSWLESHLNINLNFIPNFSYYFSSWNKSNFITFIFIPIFFFSILLLFYLNNLYKVLLWRSKKRISLLDIFLYILIV